MNTTNPNAGRPQFSVHEQGRKRVMRAAALRAGTSTQIDQFVRQDIPVHLRLHPSIHAIGIISCESGHALALTRCDATLVSPRDDRISAPAILISHETGELTMELVALVSPGAATALARILRGKQLPMGAPPGADETAFATSGTFHGHPTGTVITACPAQRLTEHLHLVGLVSTLDNGKILLIRGDDGGVSIAVPPFTAHLSVAATEALAQVLEEFAHAHGAYITGSGRSSFNRRAGAWEASDGI